MPHQSKQQFEWVGGVEQETADNLLALAAELVPGVVPLDAECPTSHAIMIAAHALIAKLDAMETSCLEALRNLGDSLASRLDGGTAHALSDHEREVVYRALEADYIARGEGQGIEAMDAALARFKKIAQLLH